MTPQTILRTACFLLLTPSVRGADAPPKEKPRTPFTHAAAVGSIAFAVDGLHIVTGSDDGIIRVWSRETGEEIRRLTGHRGRVSSLSFSPDGKLLASGSGDEAVAIWDFGSGKQLHRCTGHDGWVRSVQFSPDGKTIVSGSFDETVRLWDAVTGKELRRVEGHQAPVSGVAFTPDGRSIVSADLENVCRVCDVATGKVVHNLPKYGRGEIMGVTVCGDGRLLATALATGNLLIWNAESGELMQRLAPGAALLSLTSSADGKLILAGDREGDLHLFEAASRQRILTFAGYEREWYPLNFLPTTGMATAIHSVAFSPDGAWVAAGTKDGRLRMWRLADVLYRDDKPRKPRPEDLDAVWNDLAAADPLIASRAVVRLTTAPEITLPYLKNRLRPTPRFDAAAVRKLLADLDHDDFTIRDKATDELASFAEAVRPALREAKRGGKLSAEAGNRVRMLLERLDALEPPPEKLREARVLQGLEWLATPAARDYLTALAAGQPGASLTTEAAAALTRLGRRPSR